MFDGFYVGTESREGTQRYDAFYIASYIRRLVGDVIMEAWFDTFDGYSLSLSINVEVCFKQVWMSVLRLRAR